LAAFILAGSDVTTFELFTEEWSRHPLRVEASHQAHHAGARAITALAAALGVFSRVTGLTRFFSARASDVSAATLDVRSHVTGCLTAWE